MKVNNFSNQVKRISSIVLSLAIVLSSLIFGTAFTATAATNVWNGVDLDQQFEGAGTAENPYKITSAAELFGFANGYTAHGVNNYGIGTGEGLYFELTTDIYLNDVSNSNWMNNNPHSWLALNKWSRDSAKGFQGNFNGNGHTVYGMYYTGYNDNAAVTGLIPIASGNAVISNVNIKNAYVKESSYEGQFGSIVGFVNKNGSSASNVTITKCVADDTVDLSGVTSVQAGGICGPVRESNITIQYCGSAVKFNSSGQPAGGKGGSIVAINGGNGWATKSYTLKNSYTVAAIFNGKPQTLNSDATFYSNHSWWSSNGVTMTVVSNLNNMKGGAAYINMPNLGWDVWQANDGAYPTIKGSTNYVKPEEVNDGVDIWDGSISADYAGGTGTVTDPYLISTPEQLRRMVMSPIINEKIGANEVGKYYLLTNDIYLNDISDYTDWVNNIPANNWLNYDVRLKSFVGHVDGGGHTVYGLLHFESSSDLNINLQLYAGLIPNMGTNSSITDLHIRKSLLRGEYAGAFVGSIGGTGGIAEGVLTISGCSVDDTVQVYGLKTGGLIGVAQSGLVVENCYSSAIVAGDVSYGGIYGDAWGGDYADHTIKNFYSLNAYPTALTTSGSVGKVPDEGHRSYENVYSIFTHESDWEGINSVSSFDEMTGFSSDYWYGTNPKLLINRGRQNFDINADDSDVANAEDTAALAKILLTADGHNSAIGDLNNDGTVNLLDLVRIKKVVAGFFSVSGDTGSSDTESSIMGYQLVFNDEFNGDSIDSEKWHFTNYMGGYTDLLLKETSDVAAVTTDADNNGVLRMTASKYETGKYKTTKTITTGETMTFKYGYLEIRAKVPTSQGVWPGFWLKSDTTAGGTELAQKLGYNSNSVYDAEVDVFEMYNGIATPNLHKWWKTQEQINAYGGYRVQSGTENTYNVSDGGWHTYAMLWTPHEISMFVDDVCYQTYNLHENFYTASNKDIDMSGFHDPLCIIFDNHLFTPGYTSTSDGAWAQKYTLSDDFTSATFDIDYVRLYQKPGESEIYFAD